MTFLADENFPRPAVIYLRQKGYQVASIAENHPGITDLEVIAKAKRERLVILTFDKDYGELIFRYGEEDPPAVVYFRFKGDHPRIAGQLLVRFIEQEQLNPENAFTVIERDGIRQRTYS